MKVRAILVAAIITSTWQDGQITKDPAQDLRTCFDAAQAYTKGLTTPLGVRGPARRVTCTPATPEEAGFKPGWGCIQSYNCKGDSAYGW